MKIRTKLKNVWYTTSSFLFPLLWILTGSWTADGLGGEALFSGWCPELKGFRGWTLFAVLAVFIGLSVWLYVHRQRYFPIRMLSRRKCEPHASLILMVSTPNFVLPELAKQNEFPRELVLGNKTIPFSGNLNNDVASLNGTRWNWQQLLRAVEAHQREPKPNRIHLVGSKGEGGSYDWLNPNVA